MRLFLFWSSAAWLLHFSGQAQVVGGPVSSVTHPLLAAAPLSPTAAPPAEVLTYAEQMPAFTGGEVALHRYLATKLVYPPDAYRKGLSGKVVLQFIVDEQGRVLDPVVVKSAGPDFDTEAVRLARLMPWWEPGRERGRPVRVRSTLPIIFTFKR